MFNVFKRISGNNVVKRFRAESLNQTANVQNLVHTRTLAHVNATGNRQDAFQRSVDVEGTDIENAPRNLILEPLGKFQNLTVQANTSSHLRPTVSGLNLSLTSH